MSNFKISSYGKGLGDCFLIEISNEIFSINILIDGHRCLDKNLRLKIKHINKIDYLVVTHIDMDHIQGIIELLEDENIQKKFKNTKIIYNFVSKPIINYSHARDFEDLILKLDTEIINTCKNYYDNQDNTFLKILSFKTRTEFKPQNKEKVYITLLHPHKKEEVEEVYNDYLKKGENKQPNSKLVNKYSIALMIEFGDKRVLFTGDSNMNILHDKVNKLKNIENAKIDIIKIPHHGAKTENGAKTEDEAKTENSDLVDFALKYNCNKFIVTGEKEWKSVHPDKHLLENMNTKIKNIEIYTDIKGLPPSISYKSSSEINLI